MKISSMLPVAALFSVPLFADAAVIWTEKEILSPGVSVLTAKVSEPREIRYTAVRIDVKISDAYFFATGRCSGYGRPLEEAPTLYDSRGEKMLPADVRTKRETPAEFLQNGAKGALLAFATRATRHPYSGDFADPRGLYISDGVIVSNAKHGRGPVFVVRRNGDLEIADRIMPSEISDILVAQTGDVVIRRDGRDVVSPERRNVAPCLAIGLSKDAKTVYVVSADDGKKLAWRTGADYHDMNEAFESLGADDAISFEHGLSTGIFAASKGGVRQINQLGKSMNKARVVSSLAISLGRPRNRKPPKERINPAQVEGSFSMPKVSAVKEGNPKRTALRVQVRANLDSDLQRIKRPVLSVSALFDIDGLWRSYDVVLVNQKVSYGVNINPDQTPAGVSLWQPEVSSSEWRRPVFGDARRGLFAECGIPSSSARLLAYRLELWQNGGLVATHESDRRNLKKHGVPDDWHVKGKYSGKITYRWPPPPEKD